MDQLPPYPTYKDCGIPWLGSVPDHWQLLRSGRLFREVNDTGHPSLELLSIDRFKGIIRQADTGRKTRASEDRSLYKRIRPGELGYNLMNAFMGSIGISPQEGILSPAYAVATPVKPMNSRYYHYLLRTPVYTTEFNRCSYGIMYERNRLYYERFKTIPVPCPPVEEQTAIADYLDFNAALVSLFVRTKRRQIEILNEQRTALAKALLAQATANCSLVRLRFICSKFGSGVTPRGGATNYVEAGVPFLRSQNVHFGELRLNDVAYIPIPTHESMSGTHVRSGDVLLNITGASIGRVCAVPPDLGEANVNQHVCIIRPIVNSLDARYLAVCLSLPLSLIHI